MMHSKTFGTYHCDCPFSLVCLDRTVIIQDFPDSESSFWKLIRMLYKRESKESVCCCLSGRSDHLRTCNRQACYTLTWQSLLKIPWCYIQHRVLPSYRHCHHKSCIPDCSHCLNVSSTKGRVVAASFSPSQIKALITPLRPTLGIHPSPHQYDGVFSCI